VLLPLAMDDVELGDTSHTTVEEKKQKYVSIQIAAGRLWSGGCDYESAAAQTAPLACRSHLRRNRCETRRLVVPPTSRGCALDHNATP
jgi:hypothetical protein